MPKYVTIRLEVQEEEEQAELINPAQELAKESNTIGVIQECEGCEVIIFKVWSEGVEGKWLELYHHQPHTCKRVNRLPEK